MTPISKLSLGLLAGYLLASTAESFWHCHIQHARGSVLRLWKRYPSVFQPFIDARFSHHVVHHALTFRHGHTVQFGSENERRGLDASLPERLRRGIQRELYGASVGGFVGGLYYLRPFVLFFLPIPTLLGIWGAVGGAIPFLACVLLSAHVHPFLHMRHDVAIQKAGPVVRWLLCTRYMKSVARHHWLHHKHHRFNFNLLLGGDWLRGVVKRPTSSELGQMSQDGLETGSAGGSSKDLAR